MAVTTNGSLQSTNLEVMCSILDDSILDDKILDDKTNKNQLADDFIVSLLKMQDN